MMPSEFVIAALVTAVTLAGTVPAAEPRPWSGRYVIRSTSRATVTVPATNDPGLGFYRDSRGKWQTLTSAKRDGNTITFTVEPQEETLVVVDKPKWMVLDDRNPPRVNSATINGRDCPLREARLELGCLAKGGATLEIAAADDRNPVAPASVRFRLYEHPEVKISIRVSEGGPPSLNLRVSVDLANLEPGAYEGELGFADMAPAANAFVATVAFTVMGVKIDPDSRGVSLANAGTAYRFQPHRSNQLLLPGGIWSKLTTRTDNVWLYPREILAAEVVSDTTEHTTVRIRTNTQDIDGKPREGLGELEYELTVRADTPALFVTTRSRNISDQPVPNQANWGWLPAAYYVTSDGQKKWRGRARNEYLGVGRVGWLWLAPKKKGAPGLVWMSDLAFGESRFDTMLLYSEKKTCKPGESVDMRFAIAPANDPEEAAAMYEDLRKRALLSGK